MDIKGWDLVMDVFGRWPSFHDAEVVRLELVTRMPFTDGPDLLADVHAFEITNEIGPDKHLLLKNHVIVSFAFRGIADLRLDGWNNENALMGLRIEDARDPQCGKLRYEIGFDSNVGVDLEFLCRDVEVHDVSPWCPYDELVG